MAVVRQIKRQISETLQKTTAGKYIFTKKTLHKVVFQFMIPERLVKEAENDPTMQNRLLTEHIQKCPKKAVEIQNLVDKLLANMEMDADRKEKLNRDMLYCFFAYGYSEIIITGLRDDKSLFEEVPTLEEYCNTVIENSDVACEIEVIDGLTTFTYYQLNGDKSYTCIAAVYEGTESFWLITATCQTMNYKYAKDKFIEIFKSAQVA